MTYETMSCPKCGEQTEKGLCHRAAGLWYIRPEKIKQFAFWDEDLGKARWRRILPWRAEYYVAYLCEKCSFFAVDFSKSLSTADARELLAERASH